MTAKSQTRVPAGLLQNQHYSGTIATALYNWPLFGGILFFGLIALLAGSFMPAPWHWLLIIAGSGALVLIVNILAASFIAYDWGQKREYDRLVELGGLDKATVVIDITAGKLRGTRGLLSCFQQGHYFVIDIYDSEKMPDAALRRAREMQPALEVDRRIYRRTAKPASLPIPHNWADIIYCSFSLHEVQDPADRQAIFGEFARILKPNGRLLIAEHGRDGLNFLAFGPGVLSFLKPSAWTKYIEEAGLVIKHHERWHGLVHLWVAERKQR
jgi:ubiquinone/menaquinone biosynthesis C-methylase UbiE